MREVQRLLLIFLMPCGMHEGFVCGSGMRGKES
jgi:hypothetical protein